MNDIFRFKSMFDDDHYKGTMQAAILQLFPEAVAEYRFTNRGKQRFTHEFLEVLRASIDAMRDLTVSPEDLAKFQAKVPYMPPWYYPLLLSYRYNPESVSVSLSADMNLQLTIRGLWWQEVLWEVKLMALISELYFTIVDTKWERGDVYGNAKAKAQQLADAECFFTDFGTRRRRSFEIQREVNRGLRDGGGKFYMGTSNPYISITDVDMTPKGTVAHEFTMGMQVLESYNHCNYFALQNWVRVYNCQLGTALTDTVGTDMFFKDFNLRFANLHSGLRHDSGSPFIFADKAIAAYRALGIDPMSKMLIFSDALNVVRAININKYYKGKIKCSFGIGTFFSNDFEGSPALNMVIKLWSINGIPCVKLSDVSGKEMGDPTAIEMVKWMVRNEVGAR